MVTLAVYPRLFSNTLTFRANVATFTRVMVTLVVCPRLFEISHQVEIRGLQ